MNVTELARYRKGKVQTVAVETYLGQVKAKLPGDERTRERVLLGLREELAEYCRGKSVLLAELEAQFGSPEEVAEAFQAETGRTSNLQPEETPARKSSRQKFTLVTGIAILCLIIGGVLGAGWNRSRPTQQEEPMPPIETQWDADR